MTVGACAPDIPQGSKWEDWRFLSSAGGRPHYVVENGSVTVA
ncbi:hypothetical protein [Actinacidiphila glaucinigra]